MHFRKAVLFAAILALLVTSIHCEDVEETTTAGPGDQGTTDGPAGGGGGDGQTGGGGNDSTGSTGPAGDSGGGGDGGSGTGTPSGIAVTSGTGGGPAPAPAGDADPNVPPLGQLDEPLVLRTNASSSAVSFCEYPVIKRTTEEPQERRCVSSKQCFGVLHPTTTLGNHGHLSKYSAGIKNVFCNHGTHSINGSGIGTIINATDGQCCYVTELRPDPKLMMRFGFPTTKQNCNGSELTSDNLCLQVGKEPGGKQNLESRICAAVDPKGPMFCMLNPGYKLPEDTKSGPKPVHMVILGISWSAVVVFGCLAVLFFIFYRSPHLFKSRFKQKEEH